MITNGIVTAIKGTFKKKHPTFLPLKNECFTMRVKAKLRKIFFSSLYTFIPQIPIDNVNLKGIILNQNKLNIVTGEEYFLITNKFIV